MYEFTQQFAALEPPPEPMQQLFGALRTNQNATNAFFSAITGAISLPGIHVSGEPGPDHGGGISVGKL